MKFFLSISDWYKKGGDITIKNGIPKAPQSNILYLDNAEVYSGNKFSIACHRLTRDLKVKSVSDDTQLTDSYLIIRRPGELRIYPNFLSIFPIYIYKNSGNVLISSSFDLIMRQINYFLLNKKYLLELNLFNYAFNNDTIHKDINLLSCNEYVLIRNGKVITQKLHKTKEIFDSEVKTNYSLDDLIQMFIELNAELISDGDCISFTSGFDGRCLVAVAGYNGKKVSTFAFGTSDNIDLTLPEAQAAKLGYRFYPVKLDTSEYYEEFVKTGTDIIREYGCSTNFLQVHWTYSAKKLSRYTDTIVSGLFGSELFRAVHLQGQFVSPFLMEFFSNLETDYWIDSLRNSRYISFLKIDAFKYELEELIEQLRNYRNSVIGLNASYRFYKYVFEEIFRKFFGLQFIVPQEAYVKVITPFLNPPFIKELLKTKYSGINNKLFLKNPVKRLHGQIFYAKLLKKTNADLFKMVTGKGYRPCDLLSTTGKITITYQFVKKNIAREIGTINLDNLGIISAYERNRFFFDSIPIQDEYFDVNYVDRYRANGFWKHNEIERNKFLEILSVNEFIRHYL